MRELWVGHVESKCIELFAKEVLLFSTFHNQDISKNVEQVWGIQDLIERSGKNFLQTRSIKQFFRKTDDRCSALGEVIGDVLWFTISGNLVVVLPLVCYVSVSSLTKAIRVQMHRRVSVRTAHLTQEKCKFFAYEVDVI